MFSSLFDPKKLFREKLTGLVGVFFMLNYEITVVPRVFRLKLDTWQDNICGFTLIPPEPGAS